VKVHIRSEVDQAEWNQALEKSEYGTIYQTTYYADSIRDITKEQPIFITVEDHGKILGQLLLFKTCRFHGRVYDKPLGSLLIKFLMKTSPLYHWHFGPVTLCKEKESEAYSKILNGVRKLAKDEGTDISSSHPHPLNDRTECFGAVGFESREAATFVIDLTKDITQLWLGLEKHSARKNVERAAERGVAIEAVEDEDGFFEYFNVLNETRIREQVKPYHYTHAYKQWRMLQQRNVIKCFVAKREERTLAGIMISTFNGYLNEWGAGQSSYAIENKLYANDMLKWHIIKWGHEQGHRYYDLTGVNPNPQTPKEQGIYRFKAKWGGRLVAYHEYCLKVR